ncbi:transmembrane protein 245 [Tetranychus urticae]|uniref:Transmembrane protein 245 n=1 Tax=Tetranychus urticae TaxID=32264 RepID=T1KZK3_TETUR|nr:transmembrane protein 245 [Tetranychus urticae]
MVRPGDVSRLISPFNDVFNLITEGNEKALKQAFYNTIAILFILFVLSSVAAVYLVLQPFLQPLLWATLIGSVLHPFKRKLTRFSRWWLTDDTKRPISISVIKMPLTLINFIVNSVAKIVQHYYKLLAFIFVTLLVIHLSLFYFSFTHQLISFSSQIINTLINLSNLLIDSCNAYLLITLILSQLLLNLLSPTNVVQRASNTILPFTFFFIIFKIISIIGTIGVIVCVIFTLITLTGFGASLFLHSRNETGEDVPDAAYNRFPASLKRSINFIWKCCLSLLPAHSFSISSDENGDNKNESEPMLLDTDNPPSNPDTEKVKSEDKEVQPDSVSSTKSLPSENQSDEREKLPPTGSFKLSNSYLYSVFWSCLLAQVWLRPQLLYLTPVPIFVFAVSWVWRKINGNQIVSEWKSSLRRFLENQFPFLHNSILTGIHQYYFLGDATIASFLLDSIDTICSLLTIFVLLFGVLFAVAFLAVQIYHESACLVELMGNVVNSTLVNNPQLATGFPASDLISQNVFDEMINNAYIYGRQWLQKSIRNALEAGQESSNATVLVEKQLLEVWDRVYHQWLIRNNNSTLTGLGNRSFETYSWNRLFAALKTLDLVLCANLLKENLDTVLSIFDSVWVLLKSNFTLLFTVITAVLSMILSGSTAILNCCLNFIVFATSLFYLLCSSGDEYKPVELAGRFIPNIDKGGNYLNKFGLAVEESINSVFAASFKMTVFYGLYTWLIHTLFEVRIIYIPSVLAALFGAVPFIGAYWASIPAVLELYLIHGLGGRSLLMSFFAVLPSYFVDSAIYSDIKGGGHPYLTGLAIAGGVFYLGFTGAFFGPMILCCLFVAAKLYTSIMADSSIKNSLSNVRGLRPPLKRLNTSVDL